MEKNKDPMIAAILNLLIPGVGFFYLQKQKYVIAGVLLIISTIISIIVIFIHENTFNSLNSLSRMEISLNGIAESTKSISSYIYDTNIKDIINSNAELTRSAAKTIRSDYDFLVIYFKNRFTYWPVAMFVISIAFLTYFIAKQDINESIFQQPETTGNSNYNFCKYCGVKNKDDAKFCGTCGKQIN